MLTWLGSSKCSKYISQNFILNLLCFSPYTSATFLKWRKAQEPDTRQVVLGYWGQPPGMENNQYPFLCVPGYLKSDIGDGMYGRTVMTTYQKHIT